MPVTLLALAISAFGIGTTEFIINGLLPELVADFDVSIPVAGLLLSGYAAGAVIGAPLIGAFNLADTLGSLLAGLTIEAGHGYAAPAWRRTGLSCASPRPTPPGPTR